MSPLHAHLATFARYGAWATRRLCDHVDALPEADYRADLGLFFRSVHGTLNHLLVTEHHLWYPRFAEGVSPHIALDAELEPDRARLRARLVEGADRWAGLLASWPDDRFDGVLAYRSTKGIDMRLPFAATLGHVFNHGTHHRGQVSAALTRLGHPGPELDVVWMLQEEARHA